MDPRVRVIGKLKSPKLILSTNFVQYVLNQYTYIGTEGVLIKLFWIIIFFSIS